MASWPDSGKQIDWIAQRWDPVIDKAMRKSQHRMGGRSPTQAQWKALLADLPLTYRPEDLTAWDQTTLWERCCDDAICAYSASASGFANTINVYRKNWGDEEWEHVWTTGYEIGDMLPDPWDQDDEWLYERSVQHGYVDPDEVPFEDFDRQTAIKEGWADEATDEDVQEAVRWAVEQSLEDVWQFDPACQ